MANTPNLMRRWEDFRPSKTQAFWACAACVVATMVVGFNWGGWVLGGTAAEATTRAVGDARAELASAVCVERFVRGPDASAKLASLQQVEMWKRDTFIQDGGWVSVAGIDAPVAGAAALCARQLIDSNVPAAVVLPSR